MSEMTELPSTTVASPLRVGAHWHPESWPQEQWALDIQKLKELGFNTVRLFEHAWHRFEPREWEYDFQWANRLLDDLKEAQIGVIVATPTAAPPAWLISKYPECLRVSADFRRASHGQRRVYSPVSARYCEFCARVIDQMVHSFRGHEAIIGWQIDDHLGGSDFGPEAKRSFHAWLHERFGHIDALNKAWGLEFGSQSFEYFEQIPIPPVLVEGQPVQLAEPYHPSHLLAFVRFINDQWSSFLQTQCEVIRAGFDKPIAISMTSGWGMNYFRQNQLMDRTGLSLTKDANIAEAMMQFDRMRGEKPGLAYWLLETPPAGPQAIAVAWLSYLMGGDTTLFSHLRAPWAGPEMNADSILTATGQAAPARDSVAKMVKQVNEQGAWLAQHPPLEARVAVVTSNESAWAFSIDPPEHGFNYPALWRDEFYLPVASAHYWRDVIDQNADFCPYHVILMPMVPMVYRPTKERLKQWVEEGGCLLLGPLTGHRNEEYTASIEQALGGLENLMGATAELAFNAVAGVHIAWDAPATGDVASGQSEAGVGGGGVPPSTPHGRCQAFAPTTAHVLARYSGGPASGQAAILMNKVGKGTVLTLGARVDGETWLDLVHTLCELANVKPLASGSELVAVTPRMRPDASIAGYGLVNLTDTPQTVTLPGRGVNRLSGAALEGDIKLLGHEVMLVEMEAMTEPAEAKAVTS